MRIIYSAGVWDLLHVGHENILRRSAQLGDRLVVGVVTDRGCCAYKGHYPEQDQLTRLRAVQRIPFVDAALFQEGTDPSPILRTLRPHVMTHGSDWKRLRAGQETLQELGIEWKLLPYTPGVSSTILRENGRMPLHQDFLVTAYGEAR